MRFSPYLFAASLLLAAGCKKSEEPTPDYVFGKSWYNTYQPGDDGHLIFSTTNPNLPWFHDGFRLNTDGSFLEYGLNPVDSPESRPGTWQRESSQKYRITFHDPSRKGYLLLISKPTATQLQARRDN
ncbi:hypothetical protein [Hymenobacter psychrophilus]|uniref:Lipocalin-like domain-containing protein n=1 Tax=Hymenobacter psychrophilus TaxID=651662 RepID=A0A1H3FGH1_9BACT|nr:hypothetical protein [Hymenobacter psychrophilus]SDX90040.1 hypothetical protein SAMN04488069_10463 [Hymenobacter psychrophilus]